MTKNLDETLHEFMSVTAKSKVAVVVPMFGYWKDGLSDQLNIETLKLSLERLYSSVHQLYFIFVAEAPRFTDEVANFLISKGQAGNTSGVLMNRGDSYGDYVREGFKKALETDAQFILSMNPWLLLQHNAIDILVDRINRNDAKIVSGFDLRGAIEAPEFATTKFNLPKEENDLNVDLFGMQRYAAELIGIDENYKTHAFLGRDIRQSMYTQGFDVITSQRIPIFSFEVDWKDLETLEDFEKDKAYFVSKWKFTPDIYYDKK